MQFSACAMTEPHTERPTVIVVDDDADLRAALRYSLEIEGFDVMSCASGESLLELPLPTSPACLVVDQRLSGISGIAAIETLRDRHIDLPAIIITGTPSADLRARSLLANARVVEKPLLSGLLSGAIRDVI